MNEMRRLNIVKKYGSIEEYEKRRVLKLRATALSKCQTDEERRAKERNFEFISFLKDHSDKSKIGKSCECIDCGATFVGNNRQQILCRSCFLKRRKIAAHGSLDEASKIMKEKRKQTLLERYGDENFNNRDQAKKTCIAKFGFAHQAKDANIIKKINDTKEERYGVRGYSNPEKTAKTNLDRYGCRSSAQADRVKEKSRITKLTKYGDATYSNLEKRRQTNLARHGDPYYVNKDQRQQTFQVKYGITAPSQYQEFSEKIKKTTEERYGVPCVLVLPDVQEKSIEARRNRSPEEKAKSTEKMIRTYIDRHGCLSKKVQYYYDGMYFDSSWELYYYLYLNLLQIPFIFKPEKIKYMNKDGSIHFYLPDFLVEGVYVEIKGSSLIDFDGTLLDFKKNRYEEKTELLRELQVKIISSSQIEPIISKVKSVYGSEYVKQFRVGNCDKS